MRRSALFLIGAGVGAAIAVALTFVPASADDTYSTPYAAVEVAPARLEIGVPNDQPIKHSFTISNLSTNAETIQVSQADFTITNGTYQLLPPTSTPWSIAPGLSVTSERALDMAPRSQLKLTLTYFPLSQTVLRAGALVFTPTLVNPPAAANGTGVIVKLQAVVPVLAVPAGSDGKLDQRVTLSGVPAGMNLLSAFGATVTRIGFQEPGPISVSASFKNTGNALGRFDTWFTYSNLGKDFLTVEAPPGVAMPGQTATATGNTTLNLPGQGRTDLTPIFCICRVHASSRLVLLGETSAEVTQDRWVVIAPFRLIGLTAAVLLGIWFGVRSARRERDRRRSDVHSCNQATR